MSQKTKQKPDKGGATRVATIARKTKETEIKLRMDLDGSGQYQIETGIPFFDHMLESFTRHGLFDLELEASGDVEVDLHHTVEDVGIALGQAFRDALGSAGGLRRFGSCLLPMADLHIEKRYGKSPHHCVEAAFKGVARALRDAVAIDARETGLPTVKGAL